MFQHQPAMGGEADAATVTIDQRAAQATFQGLDAAAQRRLAEVHGFGGAGEVAVLGEGDEVAKLAQIVHAYLALVFRMECIGIITRPLPVCQAR